MNRVKSPDFGKLNVGRYVVRNDGFVPSTAMGHTLAALIGTSCGSLWVTTRD